MSASVIPSRTPRTLARTATQVSRRRIVEPWYSMSSGAWPATEPSGPSTARITSATVIWSAGARQRVPAVGAAVARDDPGAAQLEQDVLEELLRDALGVGEPLSGHRPPAAAGRQLHQRPHRVVHLRRDPHPAIVAAPLTSARSATLKDSERRRPPPLLVARRGARRRVARPRPPHDRRRQRRGRAAGRAAARAARLSAPAPRRPPARLALPRHHHDRARPPARPPARGADRRRRRRRWPSRSTTTTRSTR